MSSNTHTHTHTHTHRAKMQIPYCMIDDVNVYDIPSVPLISYLYDTWDFTWTILCRIEPDFRCMTCAGNMNYPQTKFCRQAIYPYARTCMTFDESCRKPQGHFIDSPSVHVYDMNESCRKSQGNIWAFHLSCSHTHVQFIYESCRIIKENLVGPVYSCQ